MLDELTYDLNDAKDREAGADYIVYHLEEQTDNNGIVKTSKSEIFEYINSTFGVEDNYPQKYLDDDFKNVYRMVIKKFKETYHKNLVFSSQEFGISSPSDLDKFFKPETASKNASDLEDLPTYEITAADIQASKEDYDEMLKEIKDENFNFAFPKMSYEDFANNEWAKYEDSFNTGVVDIADSLEELNSTLTLFTVNIEDDIPNRMYTSVKNKEIDSPVDKEVEDEEKTKILDFFKFLHDTFGFHKENENGIKADDESMLSSDAVKPSDLDNLYSKNNDFPVYGITDKDFEDDDKYVEMLKKYGEYGVPLSMEEFSAEAYDSWFRDNIEKLDEHLMDTNIELKFFDLYTKCEEYVSTVIKVSPRDDVNGSKAEILNEKNFIINDILPRTAKYFNLKLLSNK
jgi:hypothetical protein